VLSPQVSRKLRGNFAMVVSSTDSMTSLPDRGQALAAVLYVLLPGMRGLHVEAGIWEDVRPDEDSRCFGLATYVR